MDDYLKCGAVVAASAVLYYYAFHWCESHTVRRVSCPVSFVLGL